MLISAQAGDCGNYKGRGVGVPLDGGSNVIFYSPPTRRGGGIWNPNSPTVDAAGHLLVVSANGAAFPGDAYDHTNSVLELDANAKVIDSFAPTDWAANNQGDVGLGSQGVALIGPKWAVLGGKSGPVYVLKQGDLGGIGGQVDVKNICLSFGGADPPHAVRREQRREAVVIVHHLRVGELAPQRLDLDAVGDGLKVTHCSLPVRWMVCCPHWHDDVAHRNVRRRPH
jgi:hypothetical protein